jgi:tetratricopeptide (TPR) repeat protein
LVERLKALDARAAQSVQAAGAALDAGKADEAARHLADAANRHPLHPEVLRMRAGLLSMRGEHRQALQCMRQALEQRPHDALYHNTLGTLLGQAGDYDGAVEALRRACAMQPDLADAWYNLGIMLTRSVRNEEAAEALQRAVALAPQYMTARAQLADLLRMQGHGAQAVEHYRRILAEAPWSGMAWWGLADMKTLRMTEDDIQQMQRALSAPQASDDDKMAIGFALAKALDDQGRYAQALDALASANAIARRRYRWPREAFSTGISMVLQAFETPMASAPESLGREVIFVVGMPRSGTTLVEQILASHSMVEGAGELADLPTVLAEQSRQSGLPFPRWAASMMSTDWARLGERYLERTAHWRKERPICVDKMPGNWMYIGAIRAMLPAARIIGCRRDPLENCFACYRQRLNNNEYTRDFDDLAGFWRDYDRSLSFWHARAPERVLKHDYETLLSQPEAQIRELLAFCDLPFEPQCLRFHETQREVRSPSANQVRQPLRADTARAPQYGALLDPLRRALGLSPWQA